MIFFLAAILMLCLWKMKYSETRLDAFSRPQTDSIKGVFILLVFLSHLTNDYISLGGALDSPYALFKRLTGQAIVSCFLFYSGYGVFKRLNSDEEYCHSIPKHRILSTLIRFDIAVLIYYTVNLILGKPYGVKRLLLSMTGWSSVGNSNWYIFTVLILYFLTFLAFTAFQGNSGIIALLFLVLAYMGIIGHYQKRWWWDTALCYVLGMLFAVYRRQIEDALDRSKATWVLSLVILIALYIACYFHQKFLPLYLTKLLLLPLFIVVLTLHIRIQNPIIQAAGAYLFELYILQRLAMTILKQAGLLDYNRYLYAIACLMCTVAFAWLFRRFISSRIRL